jgi:hypothetical protein
MNKFATLDLITSVRNYEVGKLNKKDMHKLRLLPLPQLRSF